MLLPGWTGLALFGAGALIGLGFVVAGLARLAAPALALQRRLETMNERPIDATIRHTLAQLATAQARVEALPGLLLRAQAALEGLDQSRRRLTEAATTVSGVVGIARFLLTPPAKN